MPAQPFTKRLRAAFGVLFDATDRQQIIRRPLEVRSTRSITEEVNSTDRSQLISDSRKLYANLGPAKGAIDDKAMYSVGRSWLPKFEGEDKEWGKTAREWLLNEFYPLADIAGRDFQTALFLASVSIDRDGDVAALLTEYETGFPAIQLLPTQAIGQRVTDVDRSGNLIAGPYRGLRCVEGVALNDQGRPVAFKLLGADDKGKDDQWISARDMALLTEPQWVDQVRGFPGFAHAILDLKDLRTTQGYEKMACALASSIGLLEWNETGLADTSDPVVALGGGIGGSAEMVTKEYLGGTVKHFKAGTAGKMETFKSERPGDQWQRFMDRLIRNACAGIGWPFELAWDISALGGANTRFVISKAMRSVEDRQDLLRPFARRAVGYAVAKAIKAGTLPPSADWWRWGFTMPPRMTADYGRDSAAQREDYLNGIINLADICGERGVDIDQHIAARHEENEKLTAAGLPVPGAYGEVQTPGTAAAASASQAGIDANGADPADPEDDSEDDAEDTAAAEMAALERRHSETIAALSQKQPIHLNVGAPIVNFTQAPAPNVTVEAPPAVVVPAPVVNMQAAAAPSVTVTNQPAAVTVYPTPPAVVNLEQPAPVVVPAPVVNVNVPALNAQINVQRDSKGQIRTAQITDTPANV